MEIIQFDHEPSDQEVYDAAYEALIQQGLPSVDIKGNCVYRNNGYRCAVGLFIPDDVYDPSMENEGDLEELIGNWSHDEWYEEGDKRLPSWFNDKEGLLAALQVAHDKGAPRHVSLDMYDEIRIAEWLNTFLEGMESIADRFHLIYRGPQV